MQSGRTDGETDGAGAGASGPAISANPRVTIACITLIENKTRAAAVDFLA